MSPLGDAAARSPTSSIPNRITQLPAAHALRGRYGGGIIPPSGRERSTRWAGPTVSSIFKATSMPTILLPSVRFSIDTHILCEVLQPLKAPSVTALTCLWPAPLLISGPAASRSGDDRLRKLHHSRRPRVAGQLSTQQVL